MTYALACEGPCNGGRIAQYDAVVQDAMHRAAGDNLAAPIPVAWLEAARTFIHTAHAHTRRVAGPGGIVRVLYACAECGTERGYGAEDARC